MDVWCQEMIRNLYKCDMWKSENDNQTLSPGVPNGGTTEKNIIAMLGRNMDNRYLTGSA